MQCPNNLDTTEDLLRYLDKLSGDNRAKVLQEIMDTAFNNGYNEGYDLGLRDARTNPACTEDD